MRNALNCSTGFAMTLLADAAAPAVHRGRILSFLSDPGAGTDAASYRYFADGALIIEKGRIAALGPADSVLAQLPRGTVLADHGDNLLLPGFIDNHIHYAQSNVIDAAGRQLLDWFQDYTFVEEGRFARS